MSADPPYMSPQYMEKEAAKFRYVVATNIPSESDEPPFYNFTPSLRLTMQETVDIATANIKEYLRNPATSSLALALQQDYKVPMPPALPSPTKKAVRSHATFLPTDGSESMLYKADQNGWVHAARPTEIFDKLEVFMDSNFCSLPQDSLAGKVPNFTPIKHRLFFHPPQAQNVYLLSENIYKDNGEAIVLCKFKGLDQPIRTAVSHLYLPRS